VNINSDETVTYSNQHSATGSQKKKKKTSGKKRSEPGLIFRSTPSRCVFARSEFRFGFKTKMDVEKWL